MKTITKSAMGFLAALMLTGAAAPTAAPARPIEGATPRCETAWPVPADVERRAAAAMLPTFGAEPMGYRAVAHLSIVVAGVPRVVPSGIGIDPDGRLIAAVRTEACDGVIQVAAPAEIDVHLGQLFELWDVRLTQHCVGETCVAEGVGIVIDGRAVEMCPGAIPIEDGSRIELSVL